MGMTKVSLTQYQHAIDVEATIRNGSLDVGIFAPVEMLSLAAGNSLLEDLKAELVRACE
jgi:ferricrocin synthase